MRRLFKDINGNRVDEISYSLDILRKHPYTKIYVGADSQKKRKTIEYAVVIAYRYGHKGCHIIYSKWNVRRKGYGRGDELIKKRLQEEINVTMEAAWRLREHSINVYQIDFDLNEDSKWKSNGFVTLAEGWAKGLDFRFAVKPSEQVATKAANHIVNE